MHRVCPDASHLGKRTGVGISLYFKRECGGKTAQRAGLNYDSESAYELTGSLDAEFLEIRCLWGGF